jgi:ankyrin repeat protein
LLTVVNMARYGEAEAMLRDDPSRIGPDGGDTIALHVSVSKRNLTAIRWLLAHGIDVNAKRRMWDLNHTALHMAIESGAIEIARLLLDAGADPNVRDDRVHATALGWAEFFGRDEIAELIRGKGGVQ